jgi:hypothetical protein
MKDFLGAVPTFAAASSFAVLLLAFIHEWAYFLAVGPQFQLLLSPSDYLNSAIGWLPALIVMAFVMMAIDLGGRRMMGFVTDDEITLKIKTHYAKERWKRWIATAAHNLIPISLFSLGLFDLLFDNPYNIGFGSYTMAAAWGFFCSWVYRHEYISSAVPHKALIWMMVVPALFVLAFATGKARAFSALDGFGSVYIVKSKYDDSEKHYIVLRNLSRGLLVRDAIAHRIAFIRWEDVTAFAAKAPIVDATPRICSWFHLKCPPSPPATP